MKTIAFILSLAALSVSVNGAQEFGYSGPTGPEFWGTLKPEWATCETGKQQSPINLSSSPTALRGVLPQYAWQPATGVPFQIGKSGTPEGDLATQQRKITLNYNGVSYSAEQFHMHYVSEHTVDNANYALELHIVSGNAQGAKLVTGIMFRVASNSDEFIAAIAKSLPLAATQKFIIPQLNFQRLLQRCNNFSNAWTYKGRSDLGGFQSRLTDN